LRTLPLIERKTALKKLLRRKRSRILYLDHVESDGRLMFEQIVAMDLEGIVCKRKDSPYKVTEKPSRHWIKIKNSRYSSWKVVKSFLSAGRSTSTVSRFPAN
jgi:ATP-dependent DNA ligase